VTSSSDNDAARSRGSGRRFVRRAAFALLTVGILFGLLETGLRVAGHYVQARYWRDIAARVQPNAVNVLAIGESTTIGIWVEKDESYPRQLEKKLREHYGTDAINVIIPPHIGQNTSQVLHRFDKYLSTFKPAAVIIMAGVNNTWSLDESNLARFLPARAVRLRARMLLDKSRALKLIRLLVYASEVKAMGLGRSISAEMSGKPRYTSWPPPRDFRDALEPEVFRELWRHDVGQMLRASKAAGARPILMSYPTWRLPSYADLETMAMEEKVSLVRNDLSFKPLVDDGTAKEVLFPDGHPNARGYAIIAANVFKVLVKEHVLDERFPGRR
jgi:lysophospholipase L1-like esterase